MSLSRSSAIVRHELRILLADSSVLTSLVLMPLVMIAFLRPLARLALADDYPGANGSEFTVPAMATMFAFFLVGFIGFSFVADRQFGTWDRLMASPARSPEIVFGKVVPAFLLAAFQQTFIFGMGVLVFGLRPTGSWLALLLVAVALCVSLTCLGVFFASVFKTGQQLNAFINLGTMVLSGISGALVPIDVLPSWARAVAPVSPQYWALRGYRRVILEHGGLDDVVGPVLVLAAIGVLGAVLALWRLRFDEAQVRAVPKSALGEPVAA